MFVPTMIHLYIICSKDLYIHMKSRETGKRRERELLSSASLLRCQKQLGLGAQQEGRLQVWDNWDSQALWDRIWTCQVTAQLTMPWCPPHILLHDTLTSPTGWGVQNGGVWPGEGCGVSHSPDLHHVFLYHPSDPFSLYSYYGHLWKLFYNSGNSRKADSESSINSWNEKDWAFRWRTGRTDLWEGTCLPKSKQVPCRLCINREVPREPGTVKWRQVNVYLFMKCLLGTCCALSMAMNPANQATDKASKPPFSWNSYVCQEWETM